MSTEPQGGDATAAPGTPRSSLPAVLGLLLTLAAMAAVGYFAFYDTGWGGAGAPRPEVTGGSPPAAPSARSGGRADPR